MKCSICEVEASKKSLVRITWSTSKDDMELQSDIWNGYAHEACVIAHNKNSGYPFYCIHSNEKDKK